MIVPLSSTGKNDPAFAALEISRTGSALFPEIPRHAMQRAKVLIVS